VSSVIGSIVELTILGVMKITSACFGLDRAVAKQPAEDGHVAEDRHAEGGVDDVRLPPAQDDGLPVGDRDGGADDVVVQPDLGDLAGGDQIGGRHIIFLSRSPGLARGEVAVQELGDSLDEATLAQRAPRAFVPVKDPTDPFAPRGGGAVVFAQVLRPRVHPTGNPLAEPLPLGQRVRTPDQPCTHPVQLNVPGRRHQVRLVHHERPEPPLPQVPPASAGGNSPAACTAGGPRRSRGTANPRTAGRRSGARGWA